MVHDGPLIVHGSPRAATCSHLEDHATERPDINSAVATCASTSNDLRGHVHWCSGHGALATLTCGVVFCGEGPTLASNEFGSAKVYELDHSVVIEQDIYDVLVRVNKECSGSQLTLGLDVAMHHTSVV